MHKFFGLLGLVFCSLSIAQETPYQALLLDKNLTDNANAVVRLDKTDIILHSSDKMTVNRRRIITVFRKDGNKALSNYVYYDPVTKLQDLEVAIFNASGKQTEKIKKRDFKDVSAVSNFSLYEDSRLKYFDFTPISYPYTIDFSYSYQTSNTAFIPQWSPISDYLVSVEKSEYRFQYPEGITVRKLEKNFGGYAISNKTSNNIIAYEISNVPVIRAEMLSPSFNNIKPRLLLGVNKFHLEGLDGQGEDWVSFGKWQYANLLVDRDQLLPGTVAKIGSMVAHISDPIEKAKKIYKYVQDNTRYISVQLGIGGWMPISAEEVDRVKYGDCKGLTNYTKALLKSQGIESYYTVVYAGKSKRDIEKDFASMQGNHVILNIPNENGDVWLECTSQKIPFGFLGDFTDDRNVLVITPEGGIIKRTPKYIEDDNKKITKANLVLASNGDLKAQVAITSRGIQYDQRSSIAALSDKMKDKHYKEYWDNINGLKISEVKLDNRYDTVEYVENVKLEATSYAMNAGNDMLFKLNPFDANSFVPDRYRNRKHPFEISRGYVDEDEYVIHLPESYGLGPLPEPIITETKYGSYEINIEKRDGGTLLYRRKFSLKKGMYPSDEYELYRDFRRTVAKGDNLKIVLTK